MERNILVYNNNTSVVEMITPLLAGEGMKLMVATQFEELKEVLEHRNVHLLITDVELQSMERQYMEQRKLTDQRQSMGQSQSMEQRQSMEQWKLIAQRQFMEQRRSREILYGLELIAYIRKKSSVPIIVVSREAGETSKILALNAGADDYVTVGCNPLELVARIKSQLRRYTQLVNMCSNIDRIYRVDELEINDICRKVSVDGREVRLTPIEYKILRLLVQERGKVLSISQIYESIWHMQAIGADNTIAVHIRHIREKIERNPKEPRYLKVVWGTGYKVG